MEQTVRCQGLKTKSLMKLLFIGYLCSFGPILIVLGGFSFFGYHVIHFNDEVMLGWHGLITALIAIPLFSFAFTLINTILLGVGLWLYSGFGAMNLRFRKILSVD